MRILFIAAGFPPYEFSENIVNGKLVLALISEGHEVAVISRTDEGPVYNAEWRDPWLPLKNITNIITYPKGNRLTRLLDIAKDLLIHRYPVEGIRWAGRAYRKSVELIKEGRVDVIMTRSPADVGHLVGLRIKKKYNIRWIANWNDPSTGIWPLPYENNLPSWRRYVFRKLTGEVLKRADINTFPSELLREHFIFHYKIPYKKTELIPHIFLPGFMPEENPGKTEGLYLCHSGNLSPERDPRNLLLAVRKFLSTKERGLFLDVLGVTTDENAELIKELHLEDNVKSLPPVPYHDALKKMCEYDVLVILEAQTGKGIFLPSKITDYAQVKKPVLALSPEISEVGNLLKRHSGGLTANIKSEEDIYNKLCLLDKLKSENNLSDLITRSTLGEHLGCPAVLKKYNELFNN
jgi:glycosyltransferase involved in cell wall biosynthesis